MKASEFEKLNAEVARVCSSARSEFDAQLEAANSEIADLRSTNAELKWQLEDMTADRNDCLALAKSNFAKILESQAREAKLREALTELSCLGNGNVPGNSIGNGIAQLALAIPHDDTALKEYRDAVIEECAKVCAVLRIAAINEADEARNDAIDYCATTIRNLKANP